MRGLFVFLAAVCLGSVTAGCAVMSTSVQETAETVEPGHLKFGADYNIGLDLTTAVFLANDTSGTFSASELAGLECYGLKLGIGVTDRLDLNAKVWAAMGGAGGRVYGKYRFTGRDARTSFAVAPGVTFVTTTSDDDEASSLDPYIAEISSNGAELPLILTHRLNDHVLVSGIVRYSLDSIEVAFPEESILSELNETFLLHRIGLVNGWSFEFGSFYLRPEAGVELTTQANGAFGLVPVVSGGLGFEF